MATSAAATADTEHRAMLIDTGEEEQKENSSGLELGQAPGEGMEAKKAQSIDTESLDKRSMIVNPPDSPKESVVLEPSEVGDSTTLASASGGRTGVEEEENQGLDDEGLINIEDIGDLSYSELKRHCKLRGLSGGGKAVHMRRRLIDHLRKTTGRIYAHSHHLRSITLCQALCDADEDVTFFDIWKEHGNVIQQELGGSFETGGKRYEALRRFVNKVMCAQRKGEDTYLGTLTSQRAS